MLVMDEPRRAMFRGRIIRTAHLVSDLPGAEGTAELLAFGRRLDLRPSWLQHAGTPREHFDLMGGRCDLAMTMGAVVDGSRLVDALRAKRSATATPGCREPSEPAR